MVRVLTAAALLGIVVAGSVVLGAINIISQYQQHRPWTHVARKVGGGGAQW